MLKFPLYAIPLPVGLSGTSGAIAFATVFAVGVVVSTAGSNNGSIMTGGRAFYAVARGESTDPNRV